MDQSQTRCVVATLSTSTLVLTSICISFVHKVFYFLTFYALNTTHSFIVKILNLYIILSCTHLYHFFPLSIHYLQYIHCFLHIVDKSITKVGKNLLVNRLTSINDTIKFDWQNLSLDSFKIKCKNIFLT